METEEEAGEDITTSMSHIQEVRVMIKEVEEVKKKEAIRSE